MILQAAFAVAVQAQDVTICNDKDFTIMSLTPAANGTAGGYRWYENNVLVSTTHTSNTSYTIKAGKAVGTYQYVRQAYATDCQLWQSGNSFTVQVNVCTTPLIPGLEWTNTLVLDSQYGSGLGSIVGGGGDVGECPSGMRRPSRDEYQTMISAGYTWRTANSGYGNTEAGTFFGTNSGSCTIANGNCLFLPARGGNGSNIGTNGYYWSSTGTPFKPGYANGIYYLTFGSNNVVQVPATAINGSDLFSVLCVQ